MKEKDKMGTVSYFGWKNLCALSKETSQCPMTHIYKPQPGQDPVHLLRSVTPKKNKSAWKY